MTRLEIWSLTDRVVINILKNLINKFDAVLQGKMTEIAKVKQPNGRKLLMGKGKGDLLVATVLVPNTEMPNMATASCMFPTIYMYISYR